MAHRALLLLIATLLFVGADARAQVTTPSVSMVETTTAPSADKKPATKWTADLRLRGQSEKVEGVDARFSPRLRARLGFHRDLSSELAFDARLATATSHRSTNQTLGDNKEPGSARRPFGLDLSYVSWKPTSPLALNAGRIPAAMERPMGSQLLLDDDLALEGVSIVSDFDLGSGWTARAATGSSWVRENYDSYYAEAQTANMLNWGQVSLGFPMAAWKGRLGAGFFNFVDVQGHLFSELAAGGVAGGNTEDPPGTAASAFIPRQIFLELKGPWATWDLGVVGEVLKNEEAVTGNLAKRAGFSVGRGNWQFSLVGQTLQRDAVPSLFVDSDFANGTTDSEGTISTLNWKAAKNVQVRTTVYWTRTAISVRPLASDRVHLDLALNF